MEVGPRNFRNVAIPQVSQRQIRGNLSLYPGSDVCGSNTPESHQRNWLLYVDTWVHGSTSQRLQCLCLPLKTTDPDTEGQKESREQPALKG